MWDEAIQSLFRWEISVKENMNCYVDKAANESKDMHLALRPSYYHLGNFILIGNN